MSPIRSVASSAALIGFASMVSRFLGVYRDRLLSGTFGAGLELDAYYAAFRIPDLFFNLFVLGALSAGFIPVMSALLAKDKGEESDAPSWRFVQRLVTALALVVGVASLLLGVMAPVLVPLITPGFTPENLALTVRMTRIMAVAGPVLAASSVMGSVLQSHRRFLAFAMAPVLYNVGIIGGALLLAPRFGIEGVAWGVVIGFGLHFAAQFGAARAAGFRWRWRWEPGDRDLREVVRLAIPRTLSLGMNQVNLMILTGMATTVGVGALAIFNLASNLQSFPVSLIGISFAVAAFPLIAELATAGRREELVAELGRLTRTVLFLAVPATVLFLLLRVQIVRVIFGSGRFDWQDTVLTADAMACFIFSLFAQALLPVVVRFFFALKDVATPLWTGLVAIAVERALAWWLVQEPLAMGAAGLALSFSAGTVVNLALLWWWLRRRLGPLGGAQLAVAVGRMLLAGLAAAAVTQVVKTAVGNAVNMQTFLGVFTQGAVAGAAGLAVYLAAAYALGLGESRDFTHAALRRARRLVSRRTA